MTTGEESHDEVVRQQFRAQSSGFDSYVQGGGNQDIMDWILDNLELKPEFAALDVAAGTALVGRKVASKVRRVTALDATPEMLEQGREQARAEGVDNIVFEEGDAAALPYGDNSFDVVTCRLGMHHFENPRAQAEEMSRVCRSGGQVAFIDVTSTEDPEVAARHNRLERLRDPSHTRALTVDELSGMARECGLRVTRTSGYDAQRPLSEWLDQTNTGSEERRVIIEAMDQELAGGPATGMHALRKDGELLFTHNWVIIVGQKG